MMKILSTWIFVLLTALAAGSEILGQGMVPNSNLKLYENYNTYGLVLTLTGQSFLCAGGSITASNIGSHAKQFTCGYLLVDQTNPDFISMFIAARNSEYSYNSSKALERVEAKIVENTEATKKMQASIEKQNAEFNTQLQKSVAKSFDGMPLTILKQMKENQEFREEMFKLLFNDAEFKKQLEVYVKESVAANQK